MLHGRMSEHRAPRPHGPLREVFDNVFVVTGEHGFGPFQMTRNMTVLRQGTELTIFNSVRLSEAGEHELAKLGTVRHLVRLGWFHGIDDPYYMHRFAPQFWSGERMVPVNVDASKRSDLAEGAAPFGQVFRFRDGDYDEGAVVVDAAGGVLVTCDSLQHNVDTKGANFLGGIMVRAFGLVGGVRVGGPWIRRMTGGKRTRLSADFTRLTSLPFRHLLSAHGVPLENAKDAVTVAVAEAVR